MEPLDNQEIKIIGECLDATIQGPFLVDPQANDPWWEFPILMGLEPHEVSDIADLWPNVDMANTDVQLAINNSMNNLLGYPHGRWAEWPDYISVPPAEVLSIFRKWRVLTRQIDGNIFQ